MRMNFAGLAVAAFCLAVLAAGQAAAAAVGIESLRGIWQSVGYGLIVEIKTDKFTTYEVTQISCIRNETLPIDRTWSVIGLPVAVSLPNNVTFRRGITDYDWRRVNSLPVECSTQAGSTGAQEHFDTLWQTFAEHYAFFEERRVNWQVLRDRLRPPDVELSDAELFSLLTNLLAPLNDRHVVLSNGRETSVSGRPAEWPTAPDGLTEHTAELQAALNRFLARRLLNGKVTSAANDRVLWGWLTTDIGYLAIQEFWNLAPATAEGDGPWREGEHVQAINAVLDMALTGFSDARALVVDLRFNPGGADQAGMAVADRLTDADRPAFTKRAFWRGSQLEAQLVRLRPAPDKIFLGPVIVLIGPQTGSAAEVAALAMRQIPSVTLLGRRTAGYFSDQLVRHLANAWTFSVSNEIYASPLGEVFEGVGVPPDIESHVPKSPVTQDVRFGTELDEAVSLINAPVDR